MVQAAETTLPDKLTRCSFLIEKCEKGDGISLTIHRRSLKPIGRGEIKPSVLLTRAAKEVQESEWFAFYERGFPQHATSACGQWRSQMLSR
jgi:hypothetical protein